jgi:hypothetical protein
MTTRKVSIILWREWMKTCEAFRSLWLRTMPSNPKQHRAPGGHLKARLTWALSHCIIASRRERCCFLAFGGSTGVYGASLGCRVGFSKFQSDVSQRFVLPQPFSG